ncbi:MAG: GNAT family N-acetyltransferase [Anaerolineales bacterium]|nr:MAG: GNAT family N-acetyltransferase [Anaerolineales bacterium]
MNFKGGAEDKPASTQFAFHPLTPDRWQDLEKLFGPRGASGGCWCMWWRLKRTEFDQLRGEGNRRAMKAIVDSGEIPGILAYSKNEPVGWCSLAPRESYPTLERSRTLKKVDDQPVWSVVCFFIAKGFRRQGLMPKLLRAAVDYARQHGALIVEGYPYDPKSGKSPDPFVYTGLSSAFRKAGFVTIVQPTETRTIMRYLITD